MLTITSRTARLNQDYSGKTNEKDGQVTKLLSFSLDEIDLEAAELCALNGEAHLFNQLYDTSGPQPKSLLKGFKPLQLDETLENGAVTITLRGGSTFTFTNCTLSKIRVAHDVAAGPQLSVKVKTAPALDASLADFIANMGELVDAEIHGAAKADQAELPLNQHGEGEQSETEDKPRAGRNGSRPGVQ